LSFTAIGTIEEEDYLVPLKVSRATASLDKVK